MISPSHRTAACGSRAAGPRRWRCWIRRPGTFRECDPRHLPVAECDARRWRCCFWRRGPGGGRGPDSPRSSPLAIAGPVAAYQYATFGPANEDLFRIAQQIIAEERIPHHARPARWFDAAAGFQVGWIVIGLIALRRAVLFVPLTVVTLLTAAGTGAVLATHQPTLELLFPWRVSAVLIPVATAAILRPPLAVERRSTSRPRPAPRRPRRRDRRLRVPPRLPRTRRGGCGPRIHPGTQATRRRLPDPGPVRKAVDHPRRLLAHLRPADRPKCDRLLRTRPVPPRDRGGPVRRLQIDPVLLSEAAAWQFAAEVVERYDGPMDESSRLHRHGRHGRLAGEMAEHVHAGRARGPSMRTGPGLRCPTARAGQGPLTAAGDPGRAARAPARAAHRAGLPRPQAQRESLDFADQMALAARLARSIPAIGETERQRFRAVLLDEFQDTSEAQLVLLPRLFRHRRAACRDSGRRPQPVDLRLARSERDDAAALSRASSPTPRAPADVLPLSTSWRNDSSILDGGQLTSGPLREPPYVQTLRPGPAPAPGRGAGRPARTAEDEAGHVAAWIAAALVAAAAARTGRTAAVLCRKRSQFPRSSRRSRRPGLPVEVVGLGGLLHHPRGGRHRRAALGGAGPHPWRPADAPADRAGRAGSGRPTSTGLAAWARSPAAPPSGTTAAAPGAAARPTLRGQRTGDVDRGAEPATVEAPTSQAVDSADRPARRGAGRAAAGGGPPSATVAVASGCAGLREAVAPRCARLTGLPLADLVGEAERALGLDIEVLAGPSTPRPRPAPTSTRSPTSRPRFAGSADRPTLGGFLPGSTPRSPRSAVSTRAHRGVRRDAVQVLTVHAAKGLEWDVVAVPGLVEGSFPARSTAGTPVEGRGSGVIEPADGQGLVRRARPAALRPARRPRRAAACSTGGARPTCKALEDETSSVRQRRRRARHRRGAPAGLCGLHPGPHRVAAHRARRGPTRRRPGDLPLPHRAARAPRPGLDGRAVVAAARAGRGRQGGQPASGRAGPSAPGRSTRWPVAAAAASRRRCCPVRAASRPRRRRRPSGAAAAGAGGRVPRARDRRDAVASATARSSCCSPSAGRAAGRGTSSVIVPRHLSASAVVGPRPGPRGASPCSCAARCRRRPPSPPGAAPRFHAWVEQHYSRAAFVDVLDLPGSADEDPATTATCR